MKRKVFTHYASRITDWQIGPHADALAWSGFDVQITAQGSHALLHIAQAHDFVLHLGRRKAPPVIFDDEQHAICAALQRQAGVLGLAVACDIGQSLKRGRVLNLQFQRDASLAGPVAGQITQCRGQSLAR